MFDFTLQPCPSNHWELILLLIWYFDSVFWFDISIDQPISFDAALYLDSMDLDTQ